MKEAMSAAVAAAALLTVFAGCTSVKTSPNFNSLPLDREREAPAAHINVTMDGLYFLGFLPIWTGSAAEDGYAAIFTNTVTLENATSILTRTARTDFNATRMSDIQSHTSSIFLLPFLTSYKSIQVSGTAMR